jgi:hypothetical protein
LLAQAGLSSKSLPAIPMAERHQIAAYVTCKSRECTSAAHFLSSPLLAGMDCPWINTECNFYFLELLFLIFTLNNPFYKKAPPRPLSEKGGAGITLKQQKNNGPQG